MHYLVTAVSVQPHRLKIFEALGLNLTTALNMFLRQTVIQHKSDHCGIKRGGGGWNRQQTSRSRRQRLTPAAEPVRGRSSRKAAAPPVLSAGTGQS